MAEARSYDCKTQRMTQGGESGNTEGTDDAWTRVDTVKKRRGSGSRDGEDEEAGEGETRGISAEIGGGQRWGGKTSRHYDRRGEKGGRAKIALEQ